MNDWLKKQGLSVDDFLKSSLTLLVFFALIGIVVFFIFRKHLRPVHFVGFAIGAFYLWVVAALNNRQDKTFSGNIDDAFAGRGNDGSGRSPGLGVYGPGLLDAADWVNAQK